MRYCDKTSIVTDTPMRTVPESLSYAALVTEHAVEFEITEGMISRACEEMDEVQQWPFGSAIEVSERSVPMPICH